MPISTTPGIDTNIHMAKPQPFTTIRTANSKVVNDTYCPAL